MSNSEPQLYSRRTAARVLGDVSVATVIRLERLGRLRPIKLSGTPTGSTYYHRDEVHALVAGAHAMEANKARFVEDGTGLRVNGKPIERYRSKKPREDD